MRATLLLLIGAPILLLAACDRRGPLIRSSAPPSSAPISNAVTGEPGYVGRWASTPSACVDRAWVLTSRHLRTANGLECAFVKMTPGSAGFSGDVDCGPEGVRKAGRMTLTLTGRGKTRGLTLLGGPFDLPVPLEACPADASATAAVQIPDVRPPS